MDDQKDRVRAYPGRLTVESMGLYASAFHKALEECGDFGIMAVDPDVRKLTLGIVEEAGTFEGAMMSAEMYLELKSPGQGGKFLPVDQGLLSEAEAEKKNLERMNAATMYGFMTLLRVVFDSYSAIMPKRP